MKEENWPRVKIIFGRSWKIKNVVESFILPSSVWDLQKKRSALWTLEKITAAYDLVLNISAVQSLLAVLRVLLIWIADESEPGLRAWT